MLCVACVDEIAVPDGFKRSETFEEGEEFVAYSFDRRQGRVVPTHVRAGKIIETICRKFVFDDGTSCLTKEKFIRRDGVLFKPDVVESPVAMMPFERIQMKGDYWYVYTVARNGVLGKGSNWFSEHRMLAEFVLERSLRHDECVHHIDYRRTNNSLANLVVLSCDDHTRLHTDNVRKLNDKKWKDKNWVEKFKHEHSKFMTETNPSERRDITFDQIKSWCLQNGFCQRELLFHFKCSSGALRTKLKRAGFLNFVDFAKFHVHGWKPTQKKSIEFTFSDVCDHYTCGIKCKDIASIFGTTNTAVVHCLKKNGFTGWRDFERRYRNCKLVEVYDEETTLCRTFEVFDHDCLALRSIFVHGE